MKENIKEIMMALDDALGIAMAEEHIEIADDIHALIVKLEKRYGVNK